MSSPHPVPSSPPASTAQSTCRQARRVAYVYSLPLTAASNELPSNPGRSRMVHDLVRALGLLQAEEDDENVEDGDLDPDASSRPLEAPTPTRARILAPLKATRRDLEKFHERRYVDMLLSTNDDEIDPGSSSSSSSSSSNSSSSVFSRPRKRAKKKPTPSERRTLLLQRFSLLDDSPRFTLLPTYALGLAAGVLAGVQALQRDEADVVIMWDGGRHHAGRSKASGFCYVNDCVLAILRLMAGPKIPFIMEEEESSRDGSQVVSPDPLPPGGKEDGRSLEEGKEEAETPLSLKRAPTTTRRPRVLYLDFDVHHGDGVAEAFLSSSPSEATSDDGGSKTARCPQIVTLSLHHASPGFFPSNPLSNLTPPNTPHPHTLSLPLERGCSSATIARVWHSCVEPVRRAWKPDWVVVCCGVDGMAGDGEKTGVWNLGCGDGWRTEGELAWVIRRICEWTEEEGSGVKGVMMLGGGGYNHPNAARAFATFTSIALDRRPPLDPRTPIPDEILLDGDGPDDYGPSFDLEVPVGYQPDLNTPAYLDELSSVFATLAERIEESRRSGEEKSRRR